MQQLVGDLQDDIKSTDDEGKRLAQQLQHAEKTINATEGELKELIQSHPELQARIAAAM
jgi:septal ring factor EnvC (AmiA/AmiB activator)